MSDISQADLAIIARSPILRTDVAIEGGAAPGDCPPGQECLPSDYIDPDDCPACPECGCQLLASFDDIPGLVQWYDPEDLASFTFLSGDQVDTWADLSSAGNDLTAYQFDADRPTRTEGVLNGRAVVYDTGSNLSALFAASGEWTVVTVAQWDEPRDGDPTGSISGGDGDWNLFRGGDGSLTATTPTGGHATAADTLPTGVPHLVSIVFDGASSVMRADLVELFTGDLGAWSQTSTFAMMTNPGGNYPLRGFVGLYLAYDRALSAEELACVEDLALRTCMASQTPCPECGCSGEYAPYCLSSNATDADTTILALSPFAYYVADDASGNPQDSSGNGNHAVGTVATIAYNQGPLTSKATDSIAITAGGKIQFPTPAGTLMRDLGAGAPNPWAITGLIQFTARDGGDGGTERSWLSQLGSTGINWVMAFPGSGADTDLTNLLIGTFWRIGGDPSIPLNQPLVFCLMRDDSQIGIWGRDIVKWYVNGVLFGQCPIGDGSSTGENVFLGRPSDEFWGAPDLAWSNLALFDRALTPAEVVTIAEVLLDAADLAAAWTP